MQIQELLDRTSAGGAILFCGAGFSLDCLNLTAQQEIGAGAALLALLNEQLEGDVVAPYKDLRNAVDKFIELRSERKLLALLRDRFQLANITDEMVGIVKFPWDRIYTTNYDNGIELACIRAGKPYRPINNLERPQSVPGKGVEVVHLHGYAEKWNIHNFRRSCILGADSYFDVDSVLHEWLANLQDDFDRSSLFVFVGFAAGDFHLNQVFFNARESRSKVFFVNRPSASVDLDLEAVQKKFGTPLSIGRAGLEKLAANAIKADRPAEPLTPSFRRYERPAQARDIPAVEAIRNLFIFGKVDRSQIVRDSSLKTADYHLRRSVVDEVMNEIEGEKSVCLLTGEICDGKSLVVEDLCARLSVARPVYLVHRLYDSVVEETMSLIAAYNDVVLVIENCFDLSSFRLEAMLKLFSDTTAKLILTSRSISARAEVADFEKLSATKSIGQVRLSRLGDEEIDALISLSDQIAGWVEFPSTRVEKLRFIRERCRASLPAFLLELLRSEFVRDRYVEEYRKIVDLCSGKELSAIVGALYVAHIGHDAPVSFLSNIFRVDVGATIGDAQDRNSGLHLVHVQNGRIKTVPSIGASRILREIVPAQNKRLVVDTVVSMLRSLSDHGFVHDFDRHIFSQLMRYSILATVVEDNAERNRFFDNVSKIDYCRTQVLFWLQWHIAMVDQKKFVDAETYLNRSYTEAEAFERRTSRIYDRVQVDDRKAKFLMIRGRNEPFRSQMFFDMREACGITERLLRRDDLTHHPFETFSEILEFFERVGPRFDAALQESGRAMINRVGELVKKRAPLLDEGYPASRARLALEQFVKFDRGEGRGDSNF